MVRLSACSAAHALPCAGWIPLKLAALDCLGEPYRASELRIVFRLSKAFLSKALCRAW
jgi:hypothetical protein